MHHGIYIMGCICQLFWILQEKVGISFYFWIIRLVNSHLALYSQVRCNPLNTPWHPWNTPHDNYKFQLWQLHVSTMRAHICQVSYVILLLKLILVYLPPWHHGIYIMGCIWQPLWILQEKVGISFYFWIIRIVNSQLALYSHVRYKLLNTPQHPQKTPLQHSPTWQLQISTMRTHYEVGNFLLFLNNEVSKHTVSIVQSCQMKSPFTPLHPQNTSTWQCQI